MVLNSSRIKSVDYNESTEVLTIEFVKGGKYKYFSVSKNVYDTIIKTKSPGNYFDNFIKGKYNFKKA
jgi:lysyl-tRNA synthetase class 2